MNKTEKNKKELSPKKQLNQQIETLLTTSLNGSLNGMLPEKKLKNRIRKATKLITDGIKVKLKDEKPVKQKKDKKKKEDSIEAKEAPPIK